MARASGAGKRESPVWGAVTGLVLPSQREPLRGVSWGAASPAEASAHRLEDDDSPTPAVCCIVGRQ